MLDAIINCGRWSETVIESGPRILENMLSISVLEWLVTLVACLMCDKNIWEKKSQGIY